MKKLIFSSLILLFLSACQTRFPILSGNEVSEQDASEKAACHEDIERLELADIDYLLYASKMIDSMTQSRNIQNETANSRIRVFLSPVAHSNSDVDMTNLNTSIKNRILRSGQFIVVNNMESGDFHLSGAFEEIKQQSDASSCNEKYEVFSLQLKDSRTNKIFWSDKKIFN